MNNFPENKILIYTTNWPNELHLASIYYEKIFWSINFFKFFYCRCDCKNYYCKINCFLLYFLKFVYFNTNHNIIILLHIILYSVNYLPINWTVSHLYILVCLIISQHINSGKTVIYQLKIRDTCQSLENYYFQENYYLKKITAYKTFSSMFHS